VFGFNGKIPEPIDNRSYKAALRKFTAEDYKSIVQTYLGEVSAKLDFNKLHRFAPKLNAHQLKLACNWLKEKPLDTDSFIEYLRSQRMASNVDLAEVEGVDFDTLKGLDDLIESLEANIIVPLENDELAAEFNIRPKRGVLLAGPPGTGKTTVGRALAHRLKSKFFLIDGTFISGSQQFYGQIHQVFEAAKNNAPAIIFIDDSDVIFENKDDFGLYRYLLTMLDGLEGESSKRICVMMTTMDVGSVPPALVRSGRIELWLETRLPDYKARLEILQEHAKDLPAAIKKVNLQRLAKESEDLTGADLRRLIEDGKILVAYDKSKKKKLKDANDYFQQAMETIRTNKEKYQEAERRAFEKAAAAPSRAPYFGHYYPGNGDDDDN
jgi:ATP-dependent 26S proteasome regulatory subunit